MALRVSQIVQISVEYHVINWQSVILNSFWIVGLAILLAGFSYTYWQASDADEALTPWLNKRPFQLTFWFSCFLIGIGLIGTSLEWWETAVWVLFTLFSAYHTKRSYHQDKPSSASRKGGDL